MTFPNRELPILNRQLPEPNVESDGKRLEIVLTWESIQGEGPFAGYPAVFVRFAGCSLQCPFCDEDYTSHRHFIDLPVLVGVIKSIRKAPSLVVLTGGEPFRQNLTPLVIELVELGYSVQVETSGIFYLEDFPYNKSFIVCSPKTSRIHPKLIPKVDFWKYVIRDGSVDPMDGLPVMTLRGVSKHIQRPAGSEIKNTDIFVQPMDEQNESKNKDNMKACIASSLAFGYRLSLQQHKIMGMP